MNTNQNPLEAKLETSIKWSDYRKITTVRGDCEVRTGDATTAFWGL